MLEFHGSFCGCSGLDLVWCLCIFGVCYVICCHAFELAARFILVDGFFICRAIFGLGYPSLYGARLLCIFPIQADLYLCRFFHYNKIRC